MVGRYLPLLNVTEANGQSDLDASCQLPQNIYYAFGDCDLLLSQFLIPSAAI